MRHLVLVAALLLVPVAAQELRPDGAAVASSTPAPQVVRPWYADWLGPQGILTILIVIPGVIGVIGVVQSLKAKRYQEALQTATKTLGTVVAAVHAARGVTPAPPGQDQPVLREDQADLLVNALRDAARRAGVQPYLDPIVQALKLEGQDVAVVVQQELRRTSKKLQRGEITLPAADAPAPPEPPAPSPPPVV